MPHMAGFGPFPWICNASNLGLSLWDIIDHFFTSFHIKLLSKAVKKTKYWLLKHVLTPLCEVWQIIDLPASTSPFQLLDFWMQIPGRTLTCSFWMGPWDGFAVCSKINLTNHTTKMVCSTQTETGASSRKTTPQSCCWGGHIETDTANSRNAKFWLQYGDGTEHFFSLIGNSFNIVGHRLWVCLSILNIFRLTFPLFNMFISLENHLRAIFVTSSFESAFPAQFRGVLSRLPDAWTSLPPPFVPVKTGLRCCKLSNSCAN